jgi:hypothetical protein
VAHKYQEKLCAPEFFFDLQMPGAHIILICGKYKYTEIIIKKNNSLPPISLWVPDGVLSPNLLK